MSKRRSSVKQEMRQPEVASPQRWLVLEATALLESVAATNLTSYGRRGSAQHPAAGMSHDEELLVLCGELRLIAGDGATRLALPDLTLTRAQHSERQTVWTGYDVVRRLQVIWAWDFYRIQSHVVLRAGLPPEAAAPEVDWSAAVSAVRAAGPRDALELAVQSDYGSLVQRHTLGAPASEWAPGA